TATVYEADDGDFMKNIELPGQAGAIAGDGTSNRVYSVINDKNEITVIDARTRKVTSHWPFPAGTKVLGLMLDPKHQNLFLSCTDKIIVMACGDGRIIATHYVDEPLY